MKDLNTLSKSINEHTTEDREIKITPQVITDLDTNTQLNTTAELKLSENIDISPYMLTDSNFVGYESLDQQEHIYRLSAFGVLNNESKSVLDLGCGRGDFGSYIRKVINPNIEYTGVDVNKLMIDIGQTKYNDLTFIVEDYFNLNHQSEYEWVFNNINCTIPYGYHTGDKWEQLYDLINKSLTYCTVGCVFMLLNDKTTFDGFYQYNPGELISYINKLNLRYAVDNTDIHDLYKLVIFKHQF